MKRPAIATWSSAKQGYLFGILIAIFLVPLAQPRTAYAQCAGVCQSNEVLVGEDRTSCYCKDRAAYAACVADTGRSWRNDHRQCAREAEECFRSQGYTLTAAGLAGIACIGNCAAVETVPMFIRSCVTSCGTAVTVATSVLEKCAADLNNRCQADALRMLRNNQLLCRK